MMVSFVVFTFLYGLVLTERDGVIGLEDRPATNSCPSVRVVNLGIRATYDESIIERRKEINATENITEYFDVLVRAAGEQHFGNISCTNISLILTYAGPLEDASVEVKDYLNFSLDAEATLANFRNYSMLHRAKLNYTDVDVLFTAISIDNVSQECNKLRTEMNQNFMLAYTPEYLAYCGEISGAAYFKGACGSNSAALVHDDGGTFTGTVGLGQAVARLLGVRYDVFREDECRVDHRDYISSMPSQFVNSPDLSTCAKNDLINFVDCVSNQTFVCWNHTVEAAAKTGHQTPYDFFTRHDYCSRYNIETHKCPAGMNVPDHKGCYKQCCKTLSW